jgi:hypothetical protein
MSSEFDAWIVPLGACDETLKEFLRAIGLLNDPGADVRGPLLSVGLECLPGQGARGRIALRVDKPEELIQLLRKRVTLLAISAAPYAELEAFHDRVFTLNQGRIEIRRAFDTKDVPNTPEATSPYAHRFFVLRYRETTAKLTLNADTDVISASPIEDRHRLWLSPIRWQADAAAVNAIFGGLEADATNLPAGPLRTTSACFLPPVPRPPTDSYFEPALRAMRATLYAPLLKDAALNPAPLNWLTVRLADEPVLSDLVECGGRLAIECGEGRRSQIALELPPGAEPWKSYRRMAILEPERLSVPLAAQALLRSLAADVRACLPRGTPIRVAAQAADWSIAPQRKYALREEGTWSRFAAMTQAFHEQHGAQHTFQQRVLAPAGPRGFTRGFDPDLVERLFIACAWRGPGTQQGDLDAWRLAMLEQLDLGELCWRDTHAALRGTSPRVLRPEERVASWRAHDPKIRFSSETLTLDYLGQESPEKLLQWQLLLPIGTLLRSRSLFLDVPARARLDGSALLA